MKEKSTINGVFEEKESHCTEFAEALFFESFRLQIHVEGEGECEKFLLKKGRKINAWETQGNTHMQPIQEGNVAIT